MNRPWSERLDPHIAVYAVLSLVTMVGDHLRLSGNTMVENYEGVGAIHLTGYLVTPNPVTTSFGSVEEFKKITDNPSTAVQ